MKKLFVPILVIILCGMVQAQDLEFASDTDNLMSEKDSATVALPIVGATTKAAISKPVCLGRHHIAFSWYGYSAALNDRLNPYYLDARRGEGGFFNYRYSFSEHIDLAVDGRGFINDVDDDNMMVNIHSEVFYSGFGVRYTFDKYWVLFPYVQGSIYQTITEIGSESKYAMGYKPEMFWGVEGNGWGLGINSGIDIRLGKLISIPVDVSYIYSKPKLVYTGYEIYDDPSTYWTDIRKYSIKEYFDISSLIISAGFSFNLGRVD